MARNMVAGYANIKGSGIATGGGGGGEVPPLSFRTTFKIRLNLLRNPGGGGV